MSDVNVLFGDLFVKVVVHIVEVPAPPVLLCIGIIVDKYAVRFFLSIRFEPSEFIAKWAVK